MTLYETISRSILAIFGSNTWQSSGITAVPENFVLNDETIMEFVRLHVIASGAGPNIVSKSGMLMVDIFTPAGAGPSRAFTIAGILDTLLANKSFGTGPGSSIQFRQSAFSSLGRDAENSALQRSSYSIPFTYTGVF